MPCSSGSPWPASTTASLASCTASTSASVVRSTKRSRQRVDGDLGRDLAAPVAAHAVGDGEQAVGLQDAVLVDLADLADVGGRAVRELGHSSSSTVFPTWSRSPRFMVIGPSTFACSGRCRWWNPGPRQRSCRHRRKTRACTVRDEGVVDGDLAAGAAPDGDLGAERVGATALLGRARPRAAGDGSSGTARPAALGPWRPWPARRLDRLAAPSARPGAATLGGVISAHTARSTRKKNR